MAANPFSTMAAPDPFATSTRGVPGQAGNPSATQVGNLGNPFASSANANAYASYRPQVAGASVPGAMRPPAAVGPPTPPMGGSAVAFQTHLASQPHLTAMRPVQQVVERPVLAGSMAAVVAAPQVQTVVQAPVMQVAPAPVMTMAPPPVMTVAPQPVVQQQMVYQEAPRVQPQYFEQVTEIPKVRVEMHEKYVEVPEPQIVDRIIEVPQIQEVVREIAPGEPGGAQQEIRLTTREVPKIVIEQVERIEEVPEIEYIDRFVEVPIVHEVVRRVPRIQVHEIPIERIIQVPKKVVQEIEQPVYRPVPHLVQQAVEREIPVPRVMTQTQEVVKQYNTPGPTPESAGAVQYTPMAETYPQGFGNVYQTAYPSGFQAATSMAPAPAAPAVASRPAVAAGNPFATGNFMPIPTTASMITPPASAAPVGMSQPAFSYPAGRLPGSNPPTPPVAPRQMTSPGGAFGAVDSNHDGMVSRDEFIRAMTASMRRPQAAH
eukprot:TRINITY_DN12232_c0_g1_i3.p1 TRINITY_DN12232_c0_g1~~TRINITY_DN12232_c0_g1_i3.p1  ORF type:complete len:488 (-),score=87.57 TRINITY_DN12232_c0_g1_i3:329-1792(-)